MKLLYFIHAIFWSIFTGIFAICETIYYHAEIASEQNCFIDEIEPLYLEKLINEKFGE